MHKQDKIARKKYRILPKVCSREGLSWFARKRSVITQVAMSYFPRRTWEGLFAAIQRKTLIKYLNNYYWRSD